MSLRLFDVCSLIFKIPVRKVLSALHHSRLPTPIHLEKMWLQERVPVTTGTTEVPGSPAAAEAEAATGGLGGPLASLSPG